MNDFLSGAVLGACISTLSFPFSVAKVQLQKDVQHRPGVSVFRAIKEVIVWAEARAVRRRERVEDTARKLDAAHMVRYDVETGNLFPTDLGRVASHFYISFTTIEIVNERLTDSSDLKAILQIISMSSVGASARREA